jgi:hypothetical protein
VKLVITICMLAAVGLAGCGKNPDDGEKADDQTSADSGCKVFAKAISVSPDKRWQIMASLAQCSTIGIKVNYTFIQIRSNRYRDKYESIFESIHVNENDRPGPAWAIPTITWLDPSNITISNLSRDAIGRFTSLTDGIAVHLQCAPSKVGAAQPLRPPALGSQSALEGVGNESMELKCPEQSDDLARSPR